MWDAPMTMVASTFEDRQRARAVVAAADARSVAADAAAADAERLDRWIARRRPDPIDDAATLWERAAPARRNLAFLAFLAFTLLGCAHCAGMRL
jgi:hypothetical protein